MTTTTKPISATQCPLCGGENDCAVAGNVSFDMNCWCFEHVIDHRIYESIPSEQRGRACICPQCASEKKSDELGSVLEKS